MANREALRELQTRLATRLQAAKTAPASASWLAVEAAGSKYLFPLGQSGEIFPWSNAMPVPYTQGWYLGVANLRGGLFGVVDLAGFVAGQVSTRTEAARTEARLVALNALLEVNCALLIDRLAGLRNIGAFVTSSEPESGAPDYFGMGYTDATGAFWQEINLQLLSQQSQFLSISA
jgi:twitching motility protein PilI